MDNYENAINANKVNSAEFKNKVLLEIQECWARRLYYGLLKDYEQSEEKKDKLYCTPTTDLNPLTKKHRFDRIYVITKMKRNFYAN